MVLGLITDANEMPLSLFALLAAVFVWWFSTGLILLAVKQAERGGAAARLSLVIWTLPIVVGGCAVLWQTRADMSFAGVYASFLGAIAIWGWLELAFLAGIVTGPVQRDCPPSAPWWERFLRAWGTIAYAEMALIATLATLTLALYQAPNTVGLWTFLILFFARVSAKLNLYFGVPKINLEFLPQHLSHLESHFRIGAASRFFPVAITLLSLVLGCWIERAVAAPAASPERVGFVLLASLTALAVIEHWLMVLPIADAKLWRWATRLKLPNRSRPGSQAYDLVRICEKWVPVLGKRPAHTKETEHQTRCYDNNLKRQTVSTKPPGALTPEDAHGL